jgi:hypothetical protein
MRFRKTPVAARELGESYHTTINLVRFGKIRPPKRDSSSEFAWSDADLERARAALIKLRRPRKQEAQP